MTVERIVPNQTGAYDVVDYKQHISRYNFASTFVEENIIGLDMACGAGYGTDVLSRKGAAKFYGVDISDKAIEYAKTNYQDERLEFIKADAVRPGLEPNSFDLVVSFETIEHLEKESGEGFIKNIKNLMKDTATLIISCPNRDTYTENYTKNKFHKYEYSFSEISRLLEKHFLHIDLYCQKIRYFKRGPKKFAQFLKHLPKPLISAITNMARNDYLNGKKLRDINRILRIFLYEYHFDYGVFPYIENYKEYKPEFLIFVCKK